MSQEITNEEKAQLLIDYMHRIMMHHAMWYMEATRQLGQDKAVSILWDAYQRSYDIQMKRLSKILGFEMQNSIPKPLLDLPDDTLESLKNAIAVNWLANDGVWFQAIETSHSMTEAKSCNDACWARFSPFEANSIKRLISLEDQPGLDGLKQALQFRLYASINKQSIIHESDNSFIFQMNECRVQYARKKKGLADYPCKSAGIIEYPSFASTIDSRIQTECIGCPPDDHPDDWYCAWRFTLP